MMNSRYINWLFSFLSPLNRKLLRDVWGMGGQVISVSMVVACGVAIYIMMNGTLVSLQNTLSVYYSRYYMANVWAPVRRAPMVQLDKLLEIPGVKRVEGRISAAALVDMASMSEPVRAKIISLPDGKQPRINAIYLKAGSFPAYSSEEVLVANSFMVAHNLSIGDRLKVTLYGVRRNLKISGIALAPEFIYSIAPGEMIPNPARFAIMWMGYDALAHAYDMDGAFNEAVLALDRNVEIDEILNQVDLVLDSYGGAGAYERKNHMSDKYLANEFNKLTILGGILPPIFLGVAAFLLNMIITRIVEQEREQIGLMKAFGYSSSDIVWHYLRLAGVIVSIGVGFGWYFGTQMGGGMANIYKSFFQFPSLYFDPPLATYLKASLFAIVSGVLGVLLAVRKTINLRPAVAMSPPVPTDYSGLGAFGAKATWMDQGLRLMVRHIARWPGRSGLTCLGIALGMAIIIGAQGGRDAINRMMDIQFDLVSRQDVTVTFTEAQDRVVLHELAALEGVIKVEPFISMPATIRFGHMKRHQGVTGVVVGADLSVLLDTQNRLVHPAPKGLTISHALASALGAGLGDILQVQFKTGQRKLVELPVVRVVSTYIGTPAYMEMAAFIDVLQDGDRVSGAYLRVDENKLDNLYVKLKAMPLVAAVDAQKTTMMAMHKSMDEVMGTMTVFNTLFASLIAVGVVFSSARISFFERQREIASLRVLGFTVAEVNAILLGELAVLTFLALPIGAFIGYELAAFMAHSLSSELFSVPVTVSNGTFGYAVSVILVSAVVSATVIARNVAKLDMITALKTRE